MKKNMKNSAILGIIFFSLMLIVSCSDKDIETHNYQFTATLETLDAQGTQFIVYQPVRFRLKLNNLAERENKITFSYDIGERKGYIYFDDPAVKYLPNTLIENDFVNDQLVFNYLPQNGGNQTIKLTVNNGTEYSVVVEKELIVNSGAVIDFIDPPTFITNLPTVPVTSMINVSNTIDADNYFNITYRIVSGAEHNVTFAVFDESLNLITATPGDTVRILNGLGNTTVRYTFSQLLEGRSPIEITIIDRYGYVVARNYNFSYFPTIELEIIGYGLHTGYFLYDNNGSPIDYKLYGFFGQASNNNLFNSAIATVKAKDIATNSAYNIKEDLNISFTLESFETLSHNNIAFRWNSSDISLNIMQNNPFALYTIPLENEIQGTFIGGWLFAYPESITNFNISTWYDTDGRKYIIKNDKIKWLTGECSFSAPTYEHINENNAIDIYEFDIP